MRRILICLWWILSVGKLWGGNVVYDVKHTGDFVFFGDQHPVVDLTIHNTLRSEALQCDIKFTVKTDKGVLISHLRQQVGIHPGDSAALAFSFYSPEPGFYKVLLEDGSEFIKELNICYEPEKMVRECVDTLSRAAFWKELGEKNGYKSPQYKVTRLKEQRAWMREAYQVTIKCSGGEILQGYYFVPARKDARISRVKLLYGEKIDLVKEKSYEGKCIDFILPVEAAQKEDTVLYANLVYKFLAGMDFVASRQESTGKPIFAEGSGLAAAVVMGAALLDTSRIKAVAVYNPFVEETTLKEGSNFRLGSLASHLKCPVLFGVGLQDKIATPRHIFDAYNRIKADKEYYLFPFSGNAEHVNWDPLKNNYFLKYVDAK